MAKPKWFNEEQKRIQSLHEQVENKERTKAQIENEVDFKQREIAQLESEISSLNQEINDPKLPLLLFYTITYLDSTGNGRGRFTHERIYYYVNTDTVDTITNIFMLEERSKNLLPGAVDLTLAFSKMSPSDVNQITAGIKSTVNHLLEKTKVSSWAHLGKLLADYYAP